MRPQPRWSRVDGLAISRLAGDSAVTFSRSETFQNALDMGDRLWCGVLPASHDLCASDDCAASGVPGPLPGELEQKQLAVAEFDDSDGGVRFHGDPADATALVADLPPLDNEGSQG